MADDAAETVTLLQRWHAGDRAALDTLLARDMPWIREHVERRLGQLLRAKGEADDYVQDAVIEVLRYGPRFLIADRERFRGLLARIVENTLRDQHDWYTAKRREIGRERPLPDGSVLALDGAARSVTRPSEHAVRNERESWVRLALELLAPEDRKVILLRQWDKRTFEEIAVEFGCTPDAARMRFNRALPRLAEKVAELRGSPSSGDARPADTEPDGVDRC